MKLARELSKRQTGTHALPARRAHHRPALRRRRKLLDVLHRLTDLGNTVIIIEHNLDVIRNADWIIDLGPEGGEDGGRLIAQGTPEQVARVKKSYTGQALTTTSTGTATAGRRNRTPVRIRDYTFPSCSTPPLIVRILCSSQFCV